MAIPNFWLEDNITNNKLNYNCVGCGNCVHSCAKNAINLEYDSEGFLYPKVNKNLCVDCDLCKKICPLQDIIEVDNPIQSIIGGYAKDKNVLYKCTSGGFATVLAESFIKKKGVVFGVRYSSDYHKAIYTKVNDLAGLVDLCGSKYIQSEKRYIFKDVKNELKNNNYVLFIGCPCDVAALKKYLVVDYNKLFTCEIACMGSTSNKVLDEYWKYIEKKYQKKLIKINMRSKKYGWYVSSLQHVFIDGKEVYKPFYGTFLGHSFLNYIRPSCLRCRFRGKNSQPDFKCGDLWGAKKNAKSWNDMGASCVILGTERAVDYFYDNMKDSFVYETLDESILYNNESFYANKSKEFIKRRNSFVESFNSFGIEKTCKLYSTFGFKVKRFMPVYLQKISKGLVHFFIDK